MTIPDYQKLMLPVLRLAAEGGEKRVTEISERIANEFGLSAEERDRFLPSGRQRVLHNRIHWAKFYMTRAGLIASPMRGRFIATQAGRELLNTSPTHIDINTLLQIPEFCEFYRGEPDTSSDEITSTPSEKAASSTPEERIEAAYQEINSTLRRDLLHRISLNSPVFFEQIIVDLLVAMGYGGNHKNAAEQLGFVDKG